MEGSDPAIAPEPRPPSAVGEATAWDRLPTRVAFWDREMRNRLSCAAFAAFVGSTPKEMIGRHAEELLGSPEIGHSLTDDEDPSIEPDGRVQ